MTRKAMAANLNCSDATVKRALARLVEKGIIARRGSNRVGYWIILRDIG